MKRFVQYSGGKDSTALYLLLLEKGLEFEPIFCDTQNEHEATYEYVNTIHEKTGGPKVKTIKADLTRRFETKRKNLPTLWAAANIPQDRIDRALQVLHPTGNVFVDLCLLMGGFPGSKARFCTTYLKIQPKRQLLSALSGRLFDYVGVRRDESIARRLMPVRDWENVGTKKKPRWVALIRPLIHWKLSDVMAQHAKHGLDPNPLYALGAERVGCWPCIFVKKRELKLIAKHSPEAIDRIREWEAIVTEATRHNQATFLPGFKMAERLNETFDPKKHGIDRQVEWSNSAPYHPKQPEFPGFEETDNAVMEEFVTQCNHWGACE